VPIINENDVTSIEELVFGDNDNLSANVAYYFDADILVLLSDMDAYYNRDAEPYRVVSTIPKEDLVGELKSQNRFATGGIVSKLNAVQFMLEHNREAFMGSGFELDDVRSFLIDRIQKGGTHFYPTLEKGDK
jgi:glutamate 5-kinase